MNVSKTVETTLSLEPAEQNINALTLFLDLKYLLENEKVDLAAYEVKIHKEGSGWQTVQLTKWVTTTNLPL